MKANKQTITNTVQTVSNTAYGMDIKLTIKNTEKESKEFKES